MTNPTVLIGSALAVVALWATAFVALLPEERLAAPAARSTSLIGTPDSAALKPLVSRASTWVDLPREEPPRAATLPRSPGHGPV
ncbi:hypothetical protein, partial [Methylobacterium oxalidis]|uniref:hypothetical protein n=1 Tax=Methylobacterium oxalidis TaxID=944322 RepID=UPI003316077F